MVNVVFLESSCGGHKVTAMEGVYQDGGTVTNGSSLTEKKQSEVILLSDISSKLTRDGSVIVELAGDADAQLDSDLDHEPTNA